MTNVEVGTRPTAPRLTDAPVSDVPAGDPVLLELVAHRGEIPGGLRHPAAPVYKDDDGMRARAGGQPQFADLIGVLPVGKVVIGRRHRQLADIGWPHQGWRRLLGLSHDNSAICEKNRTYGDVAAPPAHKRPSRSHAERYHPGRTRRLSVAIGLAALRSRGWTFQHAPSPHRWREWLGVREGIRNYLVNAA